MESNSINYIYSTDPVYYNQTDTFYTYDEKRQYAFFKSFAKHRKYSIFFPIEFYLAYYTLFIIIVGTICNLISFVTMNVRKLRNYTCMKILSILSIIDTLVLYQWNLNSFFKYHLSKPPLYEDLEEISLFWCRWISFLAFFTLQLSSWLLSFVSIDRVMVVYSSKWKHLMNSSKKVYGVIFSIISIVFLSNMHIIFKNGYVTEKLNQSFNSSNVIQKSVICYESKNDKKYIFPKWEKVHLLFYNVIPFIIMLICNSLIIYNIKYVRKVKSKTKSSSKRKRRMTVMLFLVTFSFMILTLPSVIVHTFYREFLSNKPYRRLVNLVVNNLLHTSHAINFFLYIFSAPNFRAELNNLVNDFLKRFKNNNEKYSNRITRSASYNNKTKETKNDNLKKRNSGIMMKQNHEYNQIELIEKI